MPAFGVTSATDLPLSQERHYPESRFCEMGETPSLRREFRVLGPIEVLRGGQLVDLGGAKPRMLLAALVANRNRVVAFDGLIEALWGDNPPATARKSLQKFVSALRKELGGLLVTRDMGYLIELEDDQLDAAILEKAASRDTSGEGWADTVESALSLWRGNPYPELVDTEWGVAETTRLTELRLQAEELLIESQISSGGHQGAIARLDDLVSRYPYRERLWALLMTALYRAGRQAEALDAYQRLRSILGEELGIEPSSELSDLEERILLHDPDLAPRRVARTHNLPASVTSFIGRRSELEEIGSMISAGRLVTLLGPAGSGKTRLALEFGRSVLESFPDDGVWFADLAPVSSPDSVIKAIAEGLGVGQFAERSSEDVVVDYLKGRHLLLILDNCEHLIAKAAEVTEHLLRNSEGLVVIATSRERLGIAGETIFDVGPLPYPSESESVTEEFDAVRLFLERARSVSRPGDLPNDGDEIAEIVRRLDGIPLALELAAAQVRNLGLSGVRDRLDDRFSLLTSQSRGTPLPRHQTLEAALDWSYRLLSPAEQRLFARLSVFNGGFDLESATEVCGFEPLHSDAIAQLTAELMDKSLVSVRSWRGRRRFHLLESIREYARVHLEADEGSHLRTRHMTYFRDLASKTAEHLHTSEQAAWLGLLRLDHDNFRRALRWAFDTSPGDGARLAIALSTYWDYVGPRTEANAWLARAVKVSESLDPELYADALLEASSIASSGKAAIPVDYARRALDVAEGLGDEMRTACALRALSWALAIDEQPDAALEAGMRALEIFERIGDPFQTALCEERLGQASYRDPEWSVEMLERALTTYRELGDRNREALSLHKIADRLAHSLGDIDKALEYAKRSVDICVEVGSIHDAGHAHLEYGKALRRAGDLGAAARELSEALNVTTKVGDDRCSIRAQTALGNTLLEAGELDRGASTLHQALVRGRALGEIHTTRSALAGLARVYADIGRPREAAMLLGFVEELSQNLDVPVSDRALEKREAERAQLRNLLGDEFETLWASGRTMSFEEATNLAQGAGDHSGIK